MSNLDQLLPCPVCGGEGLVFNRNADPIRVVCISDRCVYLSLRLSDWNELSNAKQVEQSLQFVAEQSQGMRVYVSFNTDNTHAFSIIESENNMFRVFERQGQTSVVKAENTTLGDAVIHLANTMEDAIIAREAQYIPDEYDGPYEIKTVPYENPYDMSDN